MVEMVYLTFISALLVVLFCFISPVLGAVAIIPFSACIVGLIEEVRLNREERQRFRQSRRLHWNGHFYD